MRPVLLCRPPGMRRQRGVAALELALITVAVFFLLPFVFWFGRVFYEYNVVLKAGHQAARYFAALPAVEIGSVGASNAAVATARQMVLDTGSGAGIDLSAVNVTLDCEPEGCGTAGQVPATIRLRFSTSIMDDVFTLFTVPVLGSATFKFSIDITAPYAD